MTNAHACYLMYMCVNFGDEIFLGGENMKPGNNSIFLKKGKTVIFIIVQVEILEFF